MYTKLRKATISFEISVCLNGTTKFPLEQIFMKLDIWVFFLKSAEKTQIPLKSDKNNGHFTRWPM